MSRAAWLRTPLLLLLAALALAGADAERCGPGADPAASRPGTSLAAMLHGAADGGLLAAPAYPTRLVLAPAAAPVLDTRPEGDDPLDGSLSGTHLRPAGSPGHGGLRTAAAEAAAARRTRLAFAHDLALARGGSLSSFGTSLPPPRA
jgi:hypothetical protein